MKILFFFSAWLQIWSILHYFKLIKIPPLYELLVIALIVSTSLYIIKNKFNNLLMLFLNYNYTFISLLYIVNKNYDNITISFKFL